jgi:hypothetical protein
MFLCIFSSFTEGHPAGNQQGSMSKLVVLPPAPLNLLPTGNEASRTAVHAVEVRSGSERKSPPATDDPLAEFYEIAKAERNQFVSSNNIIPGFLTKLITSREIVERVSPTRVMMMTFRNIQHRCLGA